MPRLPRWTVLPAALIAAPAALTLIPTAPLGQIAAPDAHGALAGVVDLHDASPSKPPTTSTCLKQSSVRCYGATQFRTAYDLGPLAKEGINGKGETIVLVDSFGSPTIRHDADEFASAYGLPKPQLTVKHVTGAIPKYDSSRTDVQGWAYETTLDVDMAHAIAPDAKLVLMETPVDETEGPVGLKDMMDSEVWAIKHASADVISQSFGATEETFPNAASIKNLRYAFKLAYARHVTELGASGDDGATDFESNAKDTYDHRVQSWPSADPLVTSVGGSNLTLNNAGDRLSPDTVWHDSSGAGGGGKSIIFKRPSWQNRVKNIVGAARGVPDISMSASALGGALVYVSFGGTAAGWQVVDGTSEATPLFAGIVALADQYAKHDLGLINPALYSLAGKATNGIVDITKGNNSFAGVKGFTAKKGFDLASGWGTVDGAKFVPALVEASTKKS